MAVEFAVNLSNIVVPGDNCFMFGCGTSRRTKGVRIWKLPNVKDEDHKKIEEDWLGEIMKTREVDRDK